MRIEQLVTFWQAQRKDAMGRWVYPDDQAAFMRYPHTFNLDFPVSAYVGNVLEAPISPALTRTAWEAGEGWLRSPGKSTMGERVYGT